MNSKFFSIAFVFLNIFSTKSFSADNFLPDSRQSPSLREVQAVVCDHVGDIAIGACNCAGMLYSVSMIHSMPMCAVMIGSASIFSCGLCLATPRYAYDVAGLMRLRQISLPTRVLAAAPEQQTMATAGNTSQSIRMQ